MDRAEEAYRNAIRLNPDHYAPYAGLAQFYERRGQRDDALSYYQKALALNPLDDDLKRRVNELSKQTSTQRQSEEPPPVTAADAFPQFGEPQGNQSEGPPLITEGAQDPFAEPQGNQ